MPQMSPMWWEILFLTFNLMLMLMMIMIYWMKNTSVKKINKNYSSKEILWKW
uniref:ATPase subunit 8 n=1 Tax=Arocatus melanocephalus TaxID=1561047 RepID=UPI002008EC4D|nr:ATPase subunit 8 [Arocatus melanocephalus]UPI55354.1 ATPase subunit 8 [Arocatus melanocephalus]